MLRQRPLREYRKDEMDAHKQRKRDNHFASNRREAKYNWNQYLGYGGNSRFSWKKFVAFIFGFIGMLKLFVELIEIFGWLRSHLQL